MKLDEYIKCCTPILNLISNFTFVFLSPQYEIKWLSDFSPERFYLSNYLFLEKNLSDCQKTKNACDDILENLKKLVSNQLDVVEFETSFENVKPIQWIARSLSNSLNEPIGFFLAGNTSSNELVHKKLKYLENFWEMIIDSVPGSIYWKSKQGHYLGCNEAMVQKSNLKTKKDIIGKTDYELWPKYASELCKKDKEVIQFNKTIESQEIVQINTGESFYFASIKTPLKDENGETMGIIGNSLDITEMVKTQHKIERINNSKSQFILNMQHDIKTPIGHIIGLADILLKSDSLLEEERNYISYIKTSAERLMELMVDILYFLDIESENVPKKEEIFDLRQMIQKIIELYIIPLQQKKIEVIVDYDKLIPKNLRGDHIRVHRILLNLFDNAVKFTKQGHIKISVKINEKIDESNYLSLDFNIEDTGLGIPEDKYEEIFEKFSRLSPSGKNLYKGLGLGLWIVNEFVSDLGGKINISSRLGYGTTFSFVLPLKIEFNNRM